MQAKELVELAVDELRVKERELREELCRLRLRKGTMQSESPMKARHLRKDLARVLTVLHARHGLRKGAAES
ncbi:MAG: 50S ribosomal protein L29 [Deltaproteobacteria bacterium]|nr:50S ribosomal protein L29 [Deltaproteobacteria bacterium]